MRMTTLIAAAGAASLLMSACAEDQQKGLELERVVLYRNGVGYFERTGEVDGNALTIKCRKDQINDVLKSLTVVDRNTGQAVSVSMPLDPQSWANAALATLAPGQGNLAQVLDALRGTHVSLDAAGATVSGRIMMVEYLEPAEGKEADQRISLLSGDDLSVVRLSQVQSVTFKDEALALQLHRSLDASAGEGMFQQVEVNVRLGGDPEHDLAISYVVSAPMWKPTYRVVLPTDDSSEGLLQAWAVVDNTSGEDWGHVHLSLTSGAPIAFRYDLHTPLTPGRTDMTRTGTAKHARVAVGETVFDEDKERPEEEVAAAEDLDDRLDTIPANKPMRKEMARRGRRSRGGMGKGDGFYKSRTTAPRTVTGGSWEQDNESPDAGVVMQQLRRSTQTHTKTKRVSGLTHFDIQDRVTVPEGSSTMVAIVNESIAAEQAFLYRPGGGGSGYETNPYRVVRFKNQTPFVLEPGPISIYAGGSFVGEGISETIAAGASATIPFAVEPTISVTSKGKSSNGEVRLIKVARGMLTVESFHRQETTWTVKGPKRDTDTKVLVRHSVYGRDYTLKDKPEGLEELDGAYLLPIVVKAGQTSAELKVVEQTPSRSRISIWTGDAAKALTSLLATTNLDAAARKKIEPIAARRAEIADIDTRVVNLRKRQNELDHRASETRANLEAIKKDPRAGNLRARLGKRLEQFTREGDKLGREIVELTSERLEKKINLDELLEGFTFTTK